MTETLHHNSANDKNLNCVGDENKARWIRVYVNIFDDHALFDDEPYSRVSAWMWLIANAAWKTKKINHKGKIIELQRGQVIVGRAFLARKWRWSEKKVRTFLALLESDNMIEMGQSNGHFANIATICNYGKYQDVPRNDDQSKGQSRASVGPEQGQTLTKNTNTTNLDSCPIADTGSVAARGPSEENQIQGLNGSTGLIVESMAHWLNPWAPDYPAAHKTIAEACRIYGPNAVRDAFADLKADHADGKVRALSHKAFYGYCRVASEGRGRKQAAPVNPKVAAHKALMERLDAKIAEMSQ